MIRTIEQISESFIQEAKSSPRMLEDLAAMEKYMSESYDGRTFVELLQNADDANSSKVKVFLVDKILIVANDGRPFDEKDIMAICRSGASSKQRGNNIGYRGVGFKSATTISTEIIIYSSGVYFTFSKTVCANTLGKTEDKVPTVRIPFVYEKNILSTEIQKAIKNCESQGYTTFFIFQNAKIHKFLAELDGFDSGWLLFLKKISEVDIKCGTYVKKCKIKRKNISDTEYQISIDGTKDHWYLITEENVSFGFKYDLVKGIIPCEPDEAVFHCFLPTIDKTGFLFKVNADFSTDPSRKHIILDECTKNALNSLQIIYASFVNRIMHDENEKLFKVLELLNTHTTLNPLVNELENGLLKCLRLNAWVLLNSEQYTKPENVKILPKWMEHTEKEFLVKNVLSYSNSTVNTKILNSIDKIDKILVRLGAQEIQNTELIQIMSDVDCVKQLSPEFLGKIFVYGNRVMFSNEEKMKHLFLPLKNGTILLSDTTSESELDEKFLEVIKNLLNKKELEDLALLYPVFQVLQKQRKVSKINSLKKLDSGKSKMAKSTALAVNKWKTPVQNCMALETLRGNRAKDSGKKCDEYDVISTTKEGTVGYIAIKTVGQLGDSFKLTEQEYATAQRLGDNYFVYVFTTDTTEVEYSVIQNPIDSINMEKVVKEWEWICDSYQAENLNETQNQAIMDEKILKNIDQSYFNSDQKTFLMKYLNNEIDLSDKKNKLSIEKINFVFDFYIGEFFFEKKGGTIEVNMAKKEALKKILQLK